MVGAATATTMQNYLASIFRHAFTALAGLGGYLAAHGMLGQPDAAAVDAAGATLGESAAVILAAVLARLVLSLVGKYLPAGAGESGPAAGGPLVLLVGTAGILILGCLPSCSMSYDGKGKPTFYLDPVALAKIVNDWQQVNDAKDANVKIIGTSAGQTIVATRPNGSTITEVINPSGVIVKP
jgi:hypothetical protein